MDSDGKKPFDPQAGNPLTKWLLYGKNIFGDGYEKDTSWRDALTNDKNLENAQKAIAVATVATVVTLGTGGLAAGLGATAIEAGVIGGASGGMASAYHKGLIEGRMPTGKEVAIDTTVGAVMGGGVAAIESKVIPAILAKTVPKPSVPPSVPEPATPAAPVEPAPPAPRVSEPPPPVAQLPGSPPRSPLKKTIEMRPLAPKGEAQGDPTVPASPGEPVKVISPKDSLYKGGGKAERPHNYIRVMPGDPANSLEYQQKPYVHLSEGGTPIGTEGTTVLKGSKEAHIPFAEWAEGKPPFPRSK